MTALLNQYEAVLDSLEEMSTTGNGESASKAAGLLNRFRDGVTLLGMVVSLKIFGPLEELNRSLQGRSETISGMIEAAEVVKAQLVLLRTGEHFKVLFAEVQQLCTQYRLDPVDLPRQRRPPLRYSGLAEPLAHDTAEGHYRAAYYQAVDTAASQLALRVDRKAADMREYLSLEKILLSGEIPEESDWWAEHELAKCESLPVQLTMFRSRHPVKTLHDAQEIFQGMVAEVRELFNDVEKLIRLMLICPVTSCSAERSFSALRRLKNWLRSTMSQQRLNAVAVCHINQSELDKLDIATLAEKFAQRSDIRRGIFGLCSN